MKIFLANTSCREDNMEKELPHTPYILESFYGLKNEKTINRVAKHDKDGFLLDSGAFTFMNSHKGKVDWEDYIERYANFINKYSIKLFFELDIDVLVGYEEVKRLRKILEQKTQKQCIPVWHKSRGIEEFKKMCKEYKYVAIGGIVVKEITKKDWDMFVPLIKYAHQNGCKIHGLGFTATKDLHKYPFDSVDSTNWLSGGRFGQLHVFNGKYIESKSFKNKRAKDYVQIDTHNFWQWVQFQKYAQKYL